jgi:hypothetical protein
LLDRINHFLYVSGLFLKNDDNQLEDRVSPWVKTTHRFESGPTWIEGLNAYNLLRTEELAGPIITAFEKEPLI